MESVTPGVEETRGSFRLLLQNELIRRSRNNPRYSLRAFARSLEYDVSSLSKILSGKRPIGRKLISRFGGRLGLPPDVIQSYRRSLSRRESDLELENDDTYQNLSLDAFQIIADWYHYAILELMRVDSFRAHPGWIARALGISRHEVNAAVERLRRTGLLRLDSKGRWIDVSGEKTSTVGNDFSAAAFRAMQRQLLEKALDSLENVPFEKRDHSSMTMAVDVSKLPEARERIRRFRRDLARRLSRGSCKHEVYNLSIAFFPLTHLMERNR